MSRRYQEGVKNIHSMREYNSGYWHPLLQLGSVSHSSRCPPPTITPRTLPSTSRIRTSSGHPLKPNERQQQERERPRRPRKADDGLFDAALPVSIAGHASVGEDDCHDGGAGEEHGVEDEDAEALEEEGRVVPEEREEAVGSPRGFSTVQGGGKDGLTRMEPRLSRERRPRGARRRLALVSVGYQRSFPRRRRAQIWTDHGFRNFY